MNQAFTDKTFVRKVDSVGRISIPPKVFDEMEITENSIVVLHIDKEVNEIVLKKDDNSCVFCGEEKTVTINDSNLELCVDCRNPQAMVKLIEDRYEKQQIPKGRRLVIPMKIRKWLDISTGDKLTIVVTKDNNLRIKK